MQYKRHVEKQCEIQAKVVAEKQPVHDSVVQNNVIQDNVDQNPQIAINNVNLSEIQHKGIITIEQEQESILHLHSKKLYFMFDRFLKSEQNDSNNDKPTAPSDMKSLLLNIVHSNQNNPEHLNIIEKTDDSVRCMVYNGNKFVTDHLSKSMRAKRVLQLLLQTIDDFLQLNNIVIKEVIRPFCENVFIPFICEQYVSSTFPDKMQVYWKNNRQLLEAIDYKQYPSINDIVLTEDIIDEQFADYQERERAIMNILQQYLKKKVEQQQRQYHRQLLNQTFNIE